MQKQEQTAQAQLRYGSRVVIITIAINAVLCLFKLAAGIFGHSVAMISDAVEGVADLFMSFFVLLGLKMANKHADEHHPYGHEKLESLIAALMSAVLAVVAVGIGYGAFNSLLHYQDLRQPNVLALIGAIVTIAVKEWMYHYTLRAGRRINSAAMEADAWHHRSDALSSVGTLAGIGGAMLGWRALDPLAALAICLLILKVAYNLAQRAFDQLVDHAAPPEVIKNIQALIAAEPEIISLDDLKTRQHGSRLYVDIEISVSHLLTLTHAHDIAENLHDKIEASNKAIKHCMVHVNPLDIEDAAQGP